MPERYVPTADEAFVLAHQSAAHGAACSCGWMQRASDAHWWHYQHLAEVLALHFRAGADQEGPR